MGVRYLFVMRQHVIHVEQVGPPIPPAFDGVQLVIFKRKGPFCDIWIDVDYTQDGKSIWDCQPEKQITSSQAQFKIFFFLKTFT